MSRPVCQRPRKRARDHTTSAEINDDSISTSANPASTSTLSIGENDFGVGFALNKALNDHMKSYHEKIIKPGTAAAKAQLEADLATGRPPAVQRLGFEEWTTELEEQVRIDCEATKSDWELPLGRRRYYLKLYKSCLFHLRCTPFDIVGVRYNMVFQKDTRVTPDAETCQDFSQVFCDRLDQLIAHPAWNVGTPEARVDALATAIQYAVILRTDDRRPWQTSVGDDFLNELATVATVNVCKREAHATVRAQHLGRNKWLGHFHISNIFLALENTIDPPEAAFMPPDTTYYHVTADDLGNLIWALDHMRDPCTQAIFGSVEIFAQAARSMRPSRARPTGRTQLETIHADAVFEEKRRIVQRDLQLKKLHALEAGDDWDDSFDGFSDHASSDSGESSVTSNTPRPAPSVV
ncbi:hypothetical protein PWT90_02841 [Aphanocladium album]|nr:hypothetical protein PWT90_02841 [Aphanocladium album]